MRKFALLLFAAAVVRASGQPRPDGLVFIPGGTFKDTKSNYYGRSASANFYLGRAVTVKSFYLGRYPVTQKEWVEVMGSNPSQFKGDTLPVETVSWYDCIDYCNRRSLREGLKPCYTLDRRRTDPGNRNPIDDLKWTVTINPKANGYRLPTEVEWEYAASGGQASRSYTYSGSDDVGKVAWYWVNSGDRPLSGFWTWSVVERNHDRTHAVGAKDPNELGLYDMSGDVRQWCWNRYAESPSVGDGPEAGAAGRVWRGGGWMGGDFCCAIAFRAGFEASGKGPDQGLRICRDD